MSSLMEERYVQLETMGELQHVVRITNFVL